MKVTNLGAVSHLRYFIALDREGLNCEAMSENLQVAWLITGDTITIELAGNIGECFTFIS